MHRVQRARPGRPGHAARLDPGQLRTASGRARKGPALNAGRDRLPAGLRPFPVTVELPDVQLAEDAGAELAGYARADACRCWGYFPSLAGRPGIHADLPACRAFAYALPEITAAGAVCQFSFLRLSLACQSTQPAYHLDTDAATALTGDPATLARRQVGRVLLNLSTTRERHLHYLDLDTFAVALAREGSYVRAAGPAPAAQYARRAVIPPRAGRLAHGVALIANRVLHSGVDGPHGHFVAAYGYDRDR